jgi:hypothetical protein
MLSFGWIAGFCSLNSDVSEHCVFSIFIAGGYEVWLVIFLKGSGYFSSQTFPHINTNIPNRGHTLYPPAYVDGTDTVFRNVGI